MSIQELWDSGLLKPVNEGDDMDREITKLFCCDLLSIAMSKAPAGCAWVTVMGNVNAVAVAALADVACIVLAEGAVLDEHPAALNKAKQQGITVMETGLPIFDTALLIYKRLNPDAFADANDPADGESQAD